MKETKSKVREEEVREGMREKGKGVSQISLVTLCP